MIPRENTRRHYCQKTWDKSFDLSVNANIDPSQIEYQYLFMYLVRKSYHKITKVASDLWVPNPNLQIVIEEIDVEFYYMNFSDTMCDPILLTFHLNF